MSAVFSSIQSCSVLSNPDMVLMQIDVFKLVTVHYNRSDVSMLLLLVNVVFSKK